MSQIGLTLDQIPTPSFIVDKSKVKANCRKIRNICENNGLFLRAQTKTHKTIEIVDFQTNGTRRGLVCSTLEECNFYVENGCDDIVFGFPLQEWLFGEVYKLAERVEKFHVFLDSPAVAKGLCKTSPPEGKEWSILIKVDCGGNRAGVWWQDIETGKAIAEEIQASSTASLTGVYVHCGNTYTKPSIEEVKSTREETIDRLNHFVGGIREAGYNLATVGIGSTPSCSHDGKSLPKLTEFHPGNYIFYDLMQEMLGSCTREEIAGIVATRVIGHYPRRQQMLIDCGFTGFTTQGPKNADFTFGLFKNEPNLRLTNMTQEIGFVEAKNGNLDFDKYPLGHMLFLLPYHSCATSGQYSKYLVVEDQTVTDEWKTVPRR